ncbi:MAG: ABC transporter permease [Cardiobacteriaceae bacterium]|nr:ABC transporter permease [Cardiobacteriaceae bacterium]
MSHHLASEIQTPIPLRQHHFGQTGHWWQSALMFLALLLLWEGAVRFGWLNRAFIAAPSEIYHQLVQLWNSGELLKHLAASLKRLGFGFGLGSALGVLVGVMIGISRLARATLLPLSSALFPVPKVALLPLFLVWFGIGEGSKIATIAFGTFFPTVIATYSAIDGVDRSLIRMGIAFGVPQPTIIRHILLPGAMAGIFAGFRISISIAITLLVVAEMMNAHYGIGAYISNAGALYQIDQLLAGVVILALLGLVLGTLMTFIERWILRWRN